MKVAGVVLEVFEDQYAAFVVVETSDNGMKSKPLAVRCYERARREQAKNLAQGDRVEVVVEVTSRKSSQGRWFTSAEAMAIRVLGNVRAEEPPSDGGGVIS